MQSPPDGRIRRRNIQQLRFVDASVSELYQELSPEEDADGLDQGVAHHAGHRPMVDWEGPGNVGSGICRLSGSYQSKQCLLGRGLGLQVYIVPWNIMNRRSNIHSTRLSTQF